MTSSKQSSVTFTHHRETVTYKLSTNALCRFEDLTGETVIRALSGLNDADKSGGLDIEFRRIRALFWAGLPDHITIIEAGDMIDDIGGVEAAFDIIGKGADLAFPEAKKEAQAEGNGKKAAPAET